MGTVAPDTPTWPEIAKVYDRRGIRPTIVAREERDPGTDVLPTTAAR
jgi:hypothetical protein